MANKLYAEASIADIADAIREKNGTQTQYKVAQMGDAVRAITTGIEPEKYEWQQTPSAVQNYLDNVDYSGVAYDTSDVQDYATASEVPALAIGKDVTVEAGTLDVGGYRKSVPAGTQTIYNCIPGAYTPYSLDANGDIAQAGTLRPTKQLRQIRCATTNCRDLGGWACDGGHIKYGILYRSGEINAADADIFLNQLGLKIELDLTADGSPSAIPGIRYVAPGQAVYYSITQRDAWKTNLRAVFDAAKYNEPLIFHCSMGADRTGTLACIIEGLLGVSQSDLDKDYELTSFAAVSFLRRRDGNYQGGTADWKHLISAIQALSGSTFRDKCVNFVASLGFTASEINAFRAAMIDGTPETVTPEIDTFTVTNNLSHATSDNPATSAAEFQPYEANITPASGYVISEVQVTMGGVDITSQAFVGEQIPAGTLNITANGNYDVAWKSSINVNVPSQETPRLPAEYQEVEWVSGVGTTLDIPITESADWSLDIESDMEFLPGSSRTLVGMGTGSGCYFGKSADGKVEMGGSVYVTGATPTARNKIGYYVIPGKGYTKIGSTSASRTGSIHGTTWSPLGLSGYTGNGVKLYHLIIVTDGFITNDLIPCYRKSDTKIGLYDLVQSSFFAMSGGTVAKGGNV